MATMCEHGNWDGCSQCQAMTKTAAEVKVGDRVLVEATVSNPEWHRATMLVDVGTTCNVKVNCSDVHSATDYATLQQRCEQLTECVRELVDAVLITEVSPRHYNDTCTCADCQAIRKVDAITDKALAIIGGKKGVGT